MHLRLERRLPCSGDVAFALLTEPDAMNRWSTARIRLESLGDGGHPAGVGALRTVDLPGVGTRLHEVIVASDAPERFVYRVYRGPGIRAHRGVITIQDAQDGAFVTWEVRADFVAPMAGTVAKRLLTRDLEDSLDRLVEIAESAPPPPSGAPPRRALDESEALPSLFDEAERILEEERALADELLRAGDPRGWFTRSYQHVTTLQLRECRRGRFTHPAWVLRLVPVFHRYYVDSLAASRGQSDGVVEDHWREAFRRMRRREVRRRSPYEQMARCTLYGMIAHIEEDLPRALAEVYLAHYRTRCDYVRFRADYLVMAPIFREAGERLLFGELSRRSIPLATRVLMQLPVEARSAVMDRRLYDIPKNRMRAFGRGKRIARLAEEHRT